MTLFDLVAQGDLDGLRQALATEPGALAVRHDSGASLLAWAAYLRKPDALAIVRAAQARLDPYEAIIIGDTDALDAALADGWDANTLSPDGFPPLALAAFFAQAASFERLLPLTADIDAQATNSQHVGAIHAATAARQPMIIEKLLRAGAAPDLVQAAGFTPLHAAAQHGDATIAGLLVLFGADPRKTDEEQRNALDHARAAGHDWLADRLAAI